MEKLIDKNNRRGILGFIFGGRDAMRNKKAVIEETVKDPGQYDQVIMSYPLWAGKMAPAARTYIEKNKEKIRNIALLSVSGSGEGNEKAVSDFEDAAGKKASAVLLLKKADLDAGTYKEKIEGFAKELTTS